MYANDFKIEVCEYYLTNRVTYQQVGYRFNIPVQYNKVSKKYVCSTLSDWLRKYKLGLLVRDNKCTTLLNNRTLSNSMYRQGALYTYIQEGVSNV